MYESYGVLGSFYELMNLCCFLNTFDALLLVLLSMADLFCFFYAELNYVRLLLERLWRWAWRGTDEVKNILLDVLFPMINKCRQFAVGGLCFTTGFGTAASI